MAINTHFMQSAERSTPSDRLTRQHLRDLETRQKTPLQKAHSWMRENPGDATTLLLDRGWNGGDYDMNVMINNSLQFGLAEDFAGNSLRNVVEKYVRLGLITSMDDADEIMELAWMPVGAE